MIYDVAIIGAGASGLMAASSIDKKHKVCLIDSNDSIGAKIKISGGSKCNITNKYLSATHYLANQNFVQNCFKKFDNKKLLKFLNQNKVFPKIDEKIVKGTYFCNSSNEVIDMFKSLTSHCIFKLNHQVANVSKQDDIFYIQTNKQTLKSKKLIVASGGLSYKTLGASDIGLKIASDFGHNIITTNPALVGFTVQKEQFWFKSLSGLSMEVKIKIDNKTIEGNLLFTHKGCSGPAILTTSLYWKKGQFSIDFKPYKNSYLPKRFKKVIKDIEDFDIHNYQMAPAGNFGYTKAEVTKGGVDISLIDDNFKSKLIKDLYFIGEVLDVTGELGGYNFQWAFSSGYICGKNLGE